MVNVNVPAGKRLLAHSGAKNYLGSGIASSSKPITFTADPPDVFNLFVPSGTANVDQWLYPRGDRPVGSTALFTITCPDVPSVQFTATISVPPPPPDPAAPVSFDPSFDPPVDP